MICLETIIGKPKNSLKVLGNARAGQALGAFFRRASPGCLYSPFFRKGFGSNADSSSFSAAKEFVEKHPEEKEKFGITFPEEGAVRFRAAHLPKQDITLEFVNGSFWTIREIFFEVIYDALECRGKIVFDVGANIGDSAISFALHGAKHVFAFEPNKELCEIAKRNIERNGLRGRISVVNAALGGESGEIEVSERYAGSPTDSLRPCENGVKVPVYTLEEALDMLPTMLSNTRLDMHLPLDPPIVLKVDIEGHEYATLLSARKEVLERFEQIVVEAHYGEQNIVRHLWECGFDVMRIKKAVASYNPDDTPHLMLVSLLSAQRGIAEKIWKLFAGLVSLLSAELKGEGNGVRNLVRK